MAEKIRTRIRLNSKEPELMAAHLFLQKKQKIKSPGPFNSPTEQILRLHTLMGNRVVQGLIASGAIRAKLRIGQPNDRYEQEADRAADQAMRKPLPTGMDTGDRREATRSARPLVQTQTIPPEEEEPLPGEEAKEPGEEREPEEEKQEEPVQTKPLIQRRAQQEEEQGGTASASGQLESRLAAQRGGGTPLPVETRLNMEARFGADFSDVRVHDDAASRQMNRGLQSQAFTHQNHIYFGSGYYDPHSYDGQRLLAHELAHVLQQGAAVRGVRRKIIVTSVTPTSSPVIQRQGGSWGSLSGLLSNLASIISGGISAGRRFFGDFLRRIPGYSLLGVVMGRDPLTGEGIARNGRNFIEAGLDVIPFGGDFKRKLEQEGALDEAAAWLDGQIAQLDFDPAQIADQFRQFWDGLGLSDVFRLGDVIRRLRNIFEPPIARLFTFARNVAVRLLEIVKSYLIRKLVEFIRGQTRAYPLLTVILGHDPISREPVERTPMNLIRGFMQLSEDGTEQLRQMEETGTLQRAANWVSGAIARLTRSLQNIRSGFTRIWQSVSIGSLMDPIGTFREIYNTFAGPVGDIFSFLIEVAGMILRFIKDALLRRLSAYARTVRGYHLLTVILGRDPFTGEAVPRTAVNFIRGFLSLLADGEERFQNLQRSGAIDRAFAWLDNEVRQLNLSWADITALFRTAWDSLSLRDLAAPLGAFQRIVNLFREPVGRIIRFAAAVGMKILEFVFEGVMGAGGARVLNILKQARDTFLTIVRDPIAFLGHLIDAVKLGIRQFARNILQHLQAGLVGWLFGALEGAGLQMPQRFDLRGIISLVLQILGLTYARIRPRLVRLMGERAVSILESTFEFLRLLVTEGPAAAWQKIVEFAGNLRDQVMEGIKSFVITRIVQAAVVRIASMFNPAGAVIQSIIAIYNTVMFFIERINQILAMVESIINSISNIAAGNIAAAANYVEQTMARTLPVIISFLARLLGLGNISGSIRNIIQRIRRPIDRAIDRIVDWIARQGRRLRRGISALGGRIRRGAGRIAGRVTQWWRRRKTFRVGNVSHSLFFDGNRIKVASDSGKTLAQYRNEVNNLMTRSNRSRQSRQELDTLFNEAMTLNANLEQAKARESAGGGQPQVNEAAFDQLAAKVRLIMGKAGSDEGIEQIIQGHPNLNSMWVRFSSASNEPSVRHAKQYFKGEVFANQSNLERAWQKLDRQDKRANGLHQRLTQIRESTRMGPNLYGGPVAAVAVIVDSSFHKRTQSGYEEISQNALFNRGPLLPEYTGASGTFESERPSSGIYGAGGHAEANALGKIADHLKDHTLLPQFGWAPQMAGGQNLFAARRSVVRLYVDKHPCVGCQGGFNRFKNDYRAFDVQQSAPPEMAP